MHEFALLLESLASLLGTMVGYIVDPIVAIVSILTGFAVRDVGVLYVGPIVVWLLIIILNSLLLAQQQLSINQSAPYILGILLACAVWVAVGWFVRKAMTKRKG